jgi:hypothetical protein
MNSGFGKASAQQALKILNLSAAALISTSRSYHDEVICAVRLRWIVSGNGTSKRRSRGVRRQPAFCGLSKAARRDGGVDV